MFESLREFGIYLWQVIQSSHELHAVVSFFVIMLAASYVARLGYKRCWSYIYVSLNYYVNTAFRLSSYTPLELTAQCRRFAATNYGAKSYLRYFRLLTEFPATSNVLLRLYQFVFYRSAKSLIELRIQPKQDNLYAAIIRRAWVSACQNAFAASLPYYQSVKDVDVNVYRYEICYELAIYLELEDADFVVLNNDMLIVQCDFYHTAKMIQNVVALARRIAKLELNQQQTQYIVKRVRNAQKQISAERAKKYADENEENATRKIEELEEMLRTLPLDDEKRAKIYNKIDYRIRKEYGKASKRMQYMMGLGGQKAGGKRVVMK